MKRFTSSNRIPMLNSGNYNWEVLKENDDTEVLRLIIGNPLGENEKVLTILYGKETLSIREFDSTYSGGFTLFMKIPFNECEKIIDSIVKGHNLTIMPLYNS